MPSRRASPSPRRPSRWRWPARWRASIPTCTSRRICRRTTPRSPSPRSSIPGRATTPTSTSTTACSAPQALFGHCIHLSEREADALSESGADRRVLPDLQPVPRLGPVRLPALPRARKAAAHRHRHRCRRRHQLFDAAHHGRGLQGHRAATARSSTRSRRFWQTDARQCRGAVDRRQGRHAGAGHRRRHRRARRRAPRRRCALRMERVETLAEELFLLQTLGDDRAVVEVYVAGPAGQVDAWIAARPDLRA